MRSLQRNLIRSFIVCVHSHDLSVFPSNRMKGALLCGGFSHSARVAEQTHLCQPHKTNFLGTQMSYDSNHHLRQRDEWSHGPIKINLGEQEAISLTYLVVSQGGNSSVSVIVILFMYSFLSKNVCNKAIKMTVLKRFSKGFIALLPFPLYRTDRNWLFESSPKHIIDTPSFLFPNWFSKRKMNKQMITPPKFKIAPDKLPSQKESSPPTIIFQGLCLC